jgi:8-oxo-dGTP pyrophosphatase MutT (NUDIX family)
VDIPIRPAATVMLVRDGTGPSPLEVLMVRRSLELDFVSGAYVFPGGALDQSDGSGAEAFCTGRRDEAVSELLDVGEGGLAYWVAALRESFEEVGLLLAYRADGSLLSFADPEEEARFAEHRRALNAGELSLFELCERESLTLACDRVFYFAHWITPLGAPRRYDTRFFVAPAPPAQHSQHDAAETIASMWVRPAEALARFEANEIEMVLPTLRNLRAIGQFPTSAALLDAAAREPAVTTVAPRYVNDEHGTRIVLRGDQGDEFVDTARRS